MKFLQRMLTCSLCWLVKVSRWVEKLVVEIPLSPRYPALSRWSMLQLATRSKLLFPLLLIWVCCTPGAHQSDRRRSGRIPGQQHPLWQHRWASIPYTRIYSHCQCPFREGQHLSFNLQISSNMKPMFCVDDSKGRNFCEEMKC